MQPDADAVARHPHLAQVQPPGMVRVDLHSHTMHSGDSTTTLDEVAEAVASSGLDVLCVTDHNATRGALELAELVGCRVVVGEEVKTYAGEIIGLFLTERIPGGLQPVEVCERIKAQGALVYIPHPFDPMRNCLRQPVLEDLVARGLVDAVEGINGKTSLQHLNETAQQFGVDHDLAVGAGSDAHVAEALGAAYVEMADFTDAADFLVQLKRGRLVGHHFDAPRRWRARIIPSIAAES
ncbi:MAG: PHP-associated domain-containing protein [Acidimicrobiales bacterium]